MSVDVRTWRFVRRNPAAFVAKKLGNELRGPGIKRGLTRHGEDDSARPPIDRLSAPVQARSRCPTHRVKHRSWMGVEEIPEVFDASRRAPTATGFAEIVGDDFPVLHTADSARFLLVKSRI
jgi:hypothetical protein